MAWKTGFYFETTCFVNDLNVSDEKISKIASIARESAFW